MHGTRVSASKLLAASLVVALGSAGALRAQSPLPPADPSDVGSIAAIVKASYEVISGPAGTPRQWRRDSTLYSPGALFIATSVDRGKTQVHTITPEPYRRGSDARMVKEGLIEREIGSHVERFGNVAQVRSVYEIRRSEAGPVEARGVNYFSLYWDGSRWWISGISWDDERPDNPIPPAWVGVHTEEGDLR
jgi:hypothetical protein